MKKKNTKLLLSEINNIWNFKPVKGTKEKVLTAEDSYEHTFEFLGMGDLYTNFMRQYLKQNGMENISFEQRACDYYFEVGYHWIVYHPFYVYDYNTKQEVLIEAGTVLYEKEMFKNMWLAVVELEKYSKQKYVCSIDELRKYTIQMFETHSPDEVSTCFTIDKYEKTFLPIRKQKGLKDCYKNEKLTTIFQVYDLGYYWHKYFVPLLGVLKEVLLFQNDEIVEQYLPIIMTIINDAKVMTKTYISEEDKHKLLQETIETMFKLRSKIESIHKFNYYSVKKWKTIFAEEKKRNENAKQEAEKLRKKFEAEKDECKRNYMEKLQQVVN